MTQMSEVVRQLKKERDKLDRAIAALSGLGASKAGRGKRKLSAAARAKIAAAQRKRWAKVKAGKAA